MNSLKLDLMISKKEALREIDEAQDFYENQLAEMIRGKDRDASCMKEIDFTSPTGTGKTVMVAKLINLFPSYYFVVTTLSRGQLRKQIESKLDELVKQNNFVVYGLNEFTTTTKLQRNDIEIRLPRGKKIIWIRDEGHIATNRWQEIFGAKAKWIINFSATNKSSSGIQCNFTHTMMLRTVTQQTGTIEAALDKLLEVKHIHSFVKNYNPCALFRILDDRNLELVFKACDERNLRYINITDQDFDMSDLCDDANPYDVIINKFKITEGIDLKRCHVIYMDSKPQNEAAVVQIIGRGRRNALFWRDDINILSPSLSKLLTETRRCYVFYNVPETEVSVNSNGELSYTLCDTISIESLRPGVTINVVNGQLPNGLKLIELSGKTGAFKIGFDKELQFNVVDNPAFYKDSTYLCSPFVIDCEGEGLTLLRITVKPNISEFFIENDAHKNLRIDNYKYWFYILKNYAESSKKDVDFEKWEMFLDTNSKGEAVKRERWLEFVRSEEIKPLIVEWNNRRETTTEEECEKARALSYFMLEKKNIFSEGFERQTRLHFSFDFLPFVDKVEYIDDSLQERIDAAISKAHCVMQIEPNRFRVAKHPLSPYLIKRGAETFEIFENSINKCSGSTIYQKKVEYWKCLLKEAKTYNQLDELDSEYVDLAALNQLLKIGLTKKEVKILSSGSPVIRLESGNYIKLLSFIGFDQKSQLIPPKSQKKIIWRHWFDEKYVPYRKTYNDREIAIIGPDFMKYVSGKYIEDRPLTSKINQYSKFKRFLQNRYQGEIIVASSKTFSGKNDFPFDKKCNSCLGFCVEYYAKMKLYGDDFYRPFINAAMREAKSKVINDAIRVRAAMLIYREEMTMCYGPALAGIIPAISVDKLVQENYSSFVEEVVKLGEKTKRFIVNKMYFETDPRTAKKYDPNLSVNHISALCDFITKDTILDLKCTSSITNQHILQVLGYHYLSTKRDDLKIKKLIIFEAVTGRFIEIDISKPDCF